MAVLPKQAVDDPLHEDSFPLFQGRQIPAAGQEHAERIFAPHVGRQGHAPPQRGTAEALHRRHEDEPQLFFGKQPVSLPRRHLPPYIPVGHIRRQLNILHDLMHNRSPPCAAGAAILFRKPGRRRAEGIFVLGDAGQWGSRRLFFLHRFGVTEIVLPLDF